MTNKTHPLRAAMMAQLMRLEMTMTNMSGATAIIIMRLGSRSAWSASLWTKNPLQGVLVSVSKLKVKLIISVLDSSPVQRIVWI